MPKVNVDFSDVSEGFKLPAEGEQICKIKSVTLEEGQKAKYLKWVLVIGIGPDKGSQIFHITSFAPSALFNLRNTLIACGLQVPKATFQVNTDLCIGKIVGITVVHQEYEKDGEKKKSAKVAEIYAVTKTDRGFVRAAQAQTEAVIDTPQTPQADFSLDDDVDEIDI